MNSPRSAVIIEDDQDIRELLSVILVQSGFEVHAESNGNSGVDAVRRHDPAVVTVDVGLPDIDGFEVVRRIRLFSDSHVIMLTARSDAMDNLASLDAGADEYLSKPFHPRELRASVDAILEQDVPGPQS